MLFKDLILSHPDITQKQWATWLGQSDGAIRHYGKGNGSPDVDRCILAFGKMPAQIQDSFLSMFVRSARRSDDPLALAFEAMTQTTALGAMLSRVRDNHARAVHLGQMLAAGEAAKRTIDAAMQAAAPLCAPGR